MTLLKQKGHRLCGHSPGFATGCQALTLDGIPIPPVGILRGDGQALSEGFQGRMQALKPWLEPGGEDGPDLSVGQGEGWGEPVGRS